MNVKSNKGVVCINIYHNVIIKNGIRLPFPIPFLTIAQPFPYQLPILLNIDNVTFFGHDILWHFVCFFLQEKKNRIKLAN